MCINPHPNLGWLLTWLIVGVCDATRNNLCCLSFRRMNSLCSLQSPWNREECELYWHTHIYIEQCIDVWHHMSTLTYMLTCIFASILMSVTLHTKQVSHKFLHFELCHRVGHGICDCTLCRTTFDYCLSIVQSWANRMITYVNMFASLTALWIFGKSNRSLVVYKDRHSFSIPLINLETRSQRHVFGLPCR